MDDLSLVDARELARKIRHKQLSSRQVTAHFLERIARDNPALQAVVVVDADNALAAAAQADSALRRGEPVGPLHGVPMTIKDCFEVAGLRTTAGAKIWRDHVPTQDSLAVQRLRAAGAIILGKTNTPAFCADVQTYNGIYGTTNNPWDLTRTAGGSSGGAAAALAAGMTPLELGSDIAGSIRTPAGFCGVFGHKSSYGLVPLRGHMPGPPGALHVPDLGVAGPLARSAEDLSLLLDVLAGPPPDLAKAYRLQLPAARAHRLRGYRVAAWFEDERAPCASAVLACLRDAVSELQHAGAHIEYVRPPIELSAAYEVFRALLDPIMSAGLPDRVVARLEAINRAGESDNPHAAFARRALIRQRDHFVWLERRAQLRASWARFFEDYDVLLCPITVVPAFAHDHSEPQAGRKLSVDGAQRSYDDLFVWNSLATCAHLPATAIPVGLTAAGLPVGMQAIGPYLEDRTTIDFAGLASERLGGFTPAPGH